MPAGLSLHSQAGGIFATFRDAAMLFKQQKKKKKAASQAWEGGIWGKWAEKPLLDLSWFLNFQGLDFFAERCFSGRGSSDSHPSPFNAVLSAASRALGSSCQRTGKSLV